MKTQNELKDIRKLIKKKCVMPQNIPGLVIKAPTDIIHRHDGLDISVLIQIIDSQQISMPVYNNGATQSGRIASKIPIP